MIRERYASCIQACNACAIACEHCAASCLREEDAAHMALCIRTDRDCADLCRLAALLMARDSPWPTRSAASAPSPARPAPRNAPSTTTTTARNARKPPALRGGVRGDG